MSGGSYNYLCWKDVPELFNSLEELELIRDRLIELKAEDAGAATQELVVKIKQFKTELASAKNRMEDIWKAVEWLDSCDDSEETFRQHLKKWRKDEKI